MARRCVEWSSGGRDSVFLVDDAINAHAAAVRFLDGNAPIGRNPATQSTNFGWCTAHACLAHQICGLRLTASYDGWMEKLVLRWYVDGVVV
jgi:hypothetical protein